MKRINLYYWIFTGLLSVLMIFSAWPDVISDPVAVTMIKDHLGYPAYFLPFIGVAKIAGAIVLLIPGFPRLKEWVYAGFVYDLIAAMYSMYSVGDPISQWIVLLIGIVLIFVSYFFHHKKLRAMKS